MSAKKQKTKDIVSTISALPPGVVASLFGETPQQINNWTTAGAPRNKNGTINLAEFIKWFRGWMQSDDKDYDAERTRKVKAEASLAELKLAEETGRLVDRSTAYRGVGEQITTARQMIEGFPQRLALLLPDEGRAAFIKEADEAVAEMLKNLTGL